jgi:hypothetical protein
MPPPSSDPPFAPAETSEHSASTAGCRRRARAGNVYITFCTGFHSLTQNLNLSPGPAINDDSITSPIDSNATTNEPGTATHDSSFRTVSAPNTVETIVMRTTQMQSIQMFNHSRRPEFHGSSLSSVGGDDRRTSSTVTYNYNISNVNISLSFAGNSEVLISLGQERPGTDLQGESVGLPSAVRIMSGQREQHRTVQQMAVERPCEFN